MSMTEIPQNTSRREMRKALIRLRMEMHRQEIRHESQQLMAPLHKMRNMRHNWQDSLGIKHAPLWGVAAVTLIGFFTGKGAKGDQAQKLQIKDRDQQVVDNVHLSSPFQRTAHGPMRWLRPRGRFRAASAR